jgi:hypothetical protein
MAEVASLLFARSYAAEAQALVKRALHDLTTSA